MQQCPCPILEKAGRKPALLSIPSIGSPFPSHRLCSPFAAERPRWRSLCLECGWMELGCWEGLPGAAETACGCLFCSASPAWTPVISPPHLCPALDPAWKPAPFCHGNGKVPLTVSPLSSASLDSEGRSAHYYLSDKRHSNKFGTSSSGMCLAWVLEGSLGVWLGSHLSLPLPLSIR